MNCKSLEQLCLIFSGINGKSSDIRTSSSALLDLLKGNQNLIVIDIDLINNKPLCNNSNITLLSDMIGYCQFLKHLDLKWYGTFDISHLTLFLAYYGSIEHITLEVTDQSSQITSCYTYSQQNCYKYIHIIDHLVVQELDFWKLFEQSDFVSRYVWDDGLECRFPHIPTMYRIVVCDVGFHTLTMSAMDAVYCVWFISHWSHI
jgi:hypothetical protein